jgi:acyl carrier protein
MIPALEVFVDALADLAQTEVDSDEPLAIMVDSLTLVEFIAWVEEAADATIDLDEIDESATLRDVWQQLAVRTASESVQ